MADDAGRPAPGTRPASAAPSNQFGTGLNSMSQEAELAGVTWEALTPAGRVGRRQGGAPSAPGGRARGYGARPLAYAIPALPQLQDTAKRNQMSPRVFAGLVRAAEFALVSGIGFLIAYVYVADFFRQYAAALALAGFTSVTV